MDESTIDLFIGGVYVIFMVFVIYLTYPIVDAILGNIAGVTRILAIAGYMVFMITLMIFIPIQLLKGKGEE